MPIETLIEDVRWDGADLARMAVRAGAATLAHLDLDSEDWDIAVLGCDDARIATLNSEFRGRAVPTNVLSWPSQERGPERPGAPPPPPVAGPDPTLGDIAIAYETCAREASEAGRTLEAHVTHLLVHGVLHLLGYDHVADADAARMQRAEIEILATLGIANPY